jgi:uncharacterized phage-like protein YoqJ
MNKEKSIVAQFHNQKSGDFNPETMVVYDPEDSGYEKYLKYKNKIESIENFGNLSELEKQIKGVLELVDSVELLDSSSVDSKDLLEKKKTIAKELINKIWDDIANYASSIFKGYEIKGLKEEKDQKEYLEMLKNADSFRKIKHNVLISDLKIAIRFIAFNFGKIDEELIDDWEEKEEEAGRDVLRVKRVSFPKNVLCPDSVDLNDRKSVASWALALFNSDRK